MRGILCAALVFVGPLSTVAMASAFDVADPVAYASAHRALVATLREEILAKHDGVNVQADLARHGHEMPLRELCVTCETTVRALGIWDAYEPSIWLYEPDSGAVSNRSADVLIAFPPAGDDASWKQVDALSADGRWVSLDAHVAPQVPVLVVRINGELSFERQIAKANEMLRDAGLQATAPKAAASTTGTGHWTTRLESIRLNDDEEPWISGAAEVYAITAGVLPGNQPQVAVVDMPYLDYDQQTYYPRQVILDWANYSYGAANVLLYEHDDNTNYQTLVAALIQAIGAGGTLAGQPEVTAIAEIVGRIVAAMPAGWFSNDDDYVDSVYTIEKYQRETRYGAAGNALVTYIPYELPAN